MFRWHIGNRRVLAALYSAQVSNDRPAISHNDVRPVSHHGVFPVRDRIENFAVGHFADPFVLESHDSREAILLGDPVARSGGAMTHRASNIEALLPALHQLARHFQGNTCSPIVAHLAGVVIIGANTESDTRMRL